MSPVPVAKPTPGHQAPSHCLSLICLALLSLLLLAGCGTPEIQLIDDKPQLNINGYQNIIIADFGEEFDTHQFAETIRESARRNKFAIYTAKENVPDYRKPATILFDYELTWTTYRVNLTVSIKDLVTGREIAATKTEGRGANPTESLKAAVKKAWKEIKFKKYEHRIHESNLVAQRPRDRSTIAVDEKKFRERDGGFDLFEGIWTERSDQYSVLIQQDSGHPGEYIGAILHSKDPHWKRGEIKFELKATGDPATSIGNYYDARKRKFSTTFYTNGVHLWAKIDNDWINLYLTYPNQTRISGSSRPAPSSASPDRIKRGSGTGFLISEDGYAITNHHVIEGATKVTAEFPLLGLSFPAKVIVKDEHNDLAVVKIDDFTIDKVDLKKIPYRLSKTQNVELGDPVSTMGFPLNDIMGENPKYTEGSVTSKSGMRDNTGAFQISVPIHNGNSGGPLFDKTRTKVVGVIYSGLTVQAVLSRSKGTSVPQNVNYAIKADYAINLLEMMHQTPKYSPEPEDSDEPVSTAELTKCVVLLKVTNEKIKDEPKEKSPEKPSPDKKPEEKPEEKSPEKPEAPPQAPQEENIPLSV